MTDEEQLSATISLRRLLASLPRWILRSRTPPASFLAKTFHVYRTGIGPATAVFPLPVPYAGLFDEQRNSRLPKAKWKKKCFQRALHAVAMALNYIHNGCRPLPVASLGWRPSLAQLKIYHRLKALLTACDQPGEEFPLPPGRSGFEFTARFVELEKFVYTCPPLDFNYDGSPRSTLTEVEKVGTMQKEHRFVVEEAFSPLQPYTSAGASRLKLSGLGQWDMQEYLYRSLGLTFHEPSILLHGQPQCLSGPDFKQESKEENVELAKLGQQRPIGCVSFIISIRPSKQGIQCPQEQHS